MTLKEWFKNLEPGELITIWNELCTTDPALEPVYLNNEDFFTGIDSVWVWRRMATANYNIDHIYLREDGRGNLETTYWADQFIDFDRLEQYVMASDKWLKWIIELGFTLHDGDYDIILRKDELYVVFPPNGYTVGVGPKNQRNFNSIQVKV